MGVRPPSDTRTFMRTSRLSLLSVLLLASACAPGVPADSADEQRDRRALPPGASWFTGNVASDFTASTAVLISDPGGLDVGVPTAGGTAVSGWDMEMVALDYDAATDVLSIGLGTFGVGGDADGDGDEAHTSSWLAGLGGADAADLGGYESFALAIDLDEDGVLDVIAGVPGDGSSQLADYTVATFSGTPFSPGLSFGSDLAAHTGGLHGAPTASAPHLEFTITRFSQLTGTLGMTDSAATFSVYAFMGSFQDAGVGEDFVPGIGTFSQVCVDLDGDGVTECAGDCDDTDASVFPGAVESCNDVDDDCDGDVDEGFDADGDGWTVCGGDCDDSEPTTNPDCGEVCDGVDNDCDGVVDNGYDADGDGVSSCDGDCDDADPTVFPGAPETCDGLDNDCDGDVDEGFDVDGDGWTTCAGDCDDNEPTTNPDCGEVCDGVDNDCDGVVDDGYDTDGDGVTECAGDCDDSDPTVFPGATEVCNSIDDDCDGTVDNAADGDGDGVNTCDGDCDDTDGSVYPGASETCDGVDNDCDGTIDDGFDADGDGVTTCAGDCDDSDAGTFPGAYETCNGEDDDCDGTIDDGYDADGDGWTSCGGDCDDSDCAVNPDAAEVCDDGTDNDCDGLTDTDDTDECTSCETYTLGEADDFNVFVFGDYTGGLDVQGAIAAGGDLDMTGFSVNGSATTTGTAIVVGDTLTLDSGTVYGDAFYGTSASLSSSVTFSGGSASMGSPIDFATAETDLQNTSAAIAGLSATAATVTPWGAVTMSGSDATLNTFMLSGSDLSSATSVSISAPAGSVVVVNIDGNAPSAGNFAISLSGVDETTVLWNFYEATSLSLTSIGWEGSLLAPYADITFSNGNFDGNLVGASLTGPAEGHLYGWDGEVEVCP